MIGANHNSLFDEEFLYANAKLPAKLAKIAKESGAQRFIHFSSVGASEKAESKDLYYKWLGEEMIKEQFPDATILRLCPVVGDNDFVHSTFASQVSYFNNLYFVYNDLMSKR